MGRLEEILSLLRDGTGPDRAGFDAFQRRLANLGIEEQMEAGEEDPAEE